MPLRVLFEDDSLIAVDKPAGFIVHQPESGNRTSYLRCCLQILRKQIGSYVYPAHRLDRATSGVLLFAKNQDSARKIQNSWQTNRVEKTYTCLTRGFLPEMTVNRPLKDANGVLKPAETYFDPLFYKEIPGARYTLALAKPVTGRFHQIRRHLARAAFPIVGDKRHGDKAHNRYFSDELGLPWMFLRATELVLPHPETGELLRISAAWNGKWHKLFDWLGFCPVMKKPRSYRARPSPYGNSLVRTLPASLE